MNVDADNYFDAAEGLHWYCVDYHGGQGSELYRVQCSLGFRPSPFGRGPGRDLSTYYYTMLVDGVLSAGALLSAILAVDA